MLQDKFGFNTEHEALGWLYYVSRKKQASVLGRAYSLVAKLRRVDGSYRYSRAYATTPVWVTAQVLPALVRKPFPLR